ncbi:MAG: VPLPA-CTERM sorting domain-containing protein [Pseudomonadota bacterium]
MKLFMTALTSALALSAGSAFATTALVSDLAAGSTLSEGKVTLSNLFFNDNSEPIAFPNDTTVDPSSITAELGVLGNMAVLSFTTTQDLNLTSPNGFLEFALGFELGATGALVSEVQLGNGDLNASGDGLIEAVFEVQRGGFGPVFDEKIEIFEDPSGPTPSQKTDSTTVPNFNSVYVDGEVEGEADFTGDTAGFSTFAFMFTFTNSVETPVIQPPTPQLVPLPAAGWMLLVGLGGLGLARRRTS